MLSALLVLTHNCKPVTGSTIMEFTISYGPTYVPPNLYVEVLCQNRPHKND